MGWALMMQTALASQRRAHWVRDRDPSRYYPLEMSTLRDIRKGIEVLRKEQPATPPDWFIANGDPREGGGSFATTRLFQTRAATGNGGVSKLPRYRPIVFRSAKGGRRKSISFRGVKDNVSSTRYSVP